MIGIQTIAIAVLAWAVFGQARAIRALHQRIDDQESWIREIGEEVRCLPETMRDSEAMRQFTELLGAASRRT